MPQLGATRQTQLIQSPYGKGLTIKKLQGHEGISQLYEYSLTLTSKDPNLGNDGIGCSGQVLLDNL